MERGDWEDEDLVSEAAAFLASADGRFSAAIHHASEPSAADLAESLAEIDNLIRRSARAVEVDSSPRHAATHPHQTMALEHSPRVRAATEGSLDLAIVIAGRVAEAMAQNPVLFLRAAIAIGKVKGMMLRRLAPVRERNVETELEITTSRGFKLRFRHSNYERRD